MSPTNHPWFSWRESRTERKAGTAENEIVEKGQKKNHNGKFDGKGPN